jgi:hypothetical protein
MCDSHLRKGRILVVERVLSERLASLLQKCPVLGFGGQAWFRGDYA